MRRTAQETKELILNTAIELFSKSGFDGLRVDDLASSAGVNKATIYYHFKDKSFIFDQILIDMTSKIQDEVNKRQENCKNVMQKLEAFIDALIYIIKNERMMAKILMQELGFSGKHLSKDVMQRFLGILKVLISIIDQGVQEGIFKKVNPILLHTTVIGGFNYYLTIKEVLGEKLSVEFEEEEESKLKEMIVAYIKKD